MVRLALATSLLLAGCVPLGSSGPDAAPGCPAIGCGPAYQIGFQRTGPWQAGTYRVEVTVDGMANSCDVIFPMDCDHPPRCQGNPGWLPTLVGCALEPGQQRIDGVVFDRTTPTMVTVAVSLGDRSLGMHTFTPMYRSFELAPGCGLSCIQAPTEVMSLAQ